MLTSRVFEQRQFRFGLSWLNVRRLTIILLLLLGEECWLVFGGGILDRQATHVAIGVVLLQLIPAVRRWTMAALDRIREPTRTQANWVAICAAVVASLLLLMFAHDRPFVPTYHDEHAYLIQMQMLARGRLWMPQHPVADFFDTFHVLVRPVYASIYFPGTALMYVPTVWFGLPYWIMPLLVAGTVVAMVYRVLTDLIDGVAGAVGALLLLSLHQFRFVSIKVLSHPLMMLWGLVGIWAWLNWRRHQNRGWALALGVAFGWGAITRPLDALCYAAPLAAGIVWHLRARTVKQAIMTVTMIFVGAAPFLSLQLIDNIGITGRWAQSPFEKYWIENWGRDPLGFAEANVAWESALLQKRAYHEYYNLPPLRNHTPAKIMRNFFLSRLPIMLQADLPNVFLLTLIPVSVLGMSDARLRLICLVGPTVLGAYALFPIYLSHHALPAAVPLAIAVLLGVRATAGGWPRQRRFIECALTLVVACLAIAALPGLGSTASDEEAPWPVMTAVHKELPKEVVTPAVVLFGFQPGDNFHEEPVYNVDVAWPDDAPIVHAQDLGPARNIEIAKYYAFRQPDRRFYRFDRRTGTVRYLGKAQEFVTSLASRRDATGVPNLQTLR